MTRFMKASPRVASACLVLLVVFLPLVSGHPASTGTAAVRRRSRKASIERRKSQSPIEDAEHDTARDDFVSMQADAEAEKESGPASVSSVKSTAAKSKAKKKKKKKAALPPAVESVSDNHNGGGQDAADGYLEVDAPLSLSERGAIIGSVLLSPAGMPGLLVGGAFGGATGYVAERIDQACNYVTSAYGERVDSDRRNEAEIAAAHNELTALADVTVRCADPEEAEELRNELIAFLEAPANQCCADCACKLERRNEAWASVNLGILVCMKCAAVHRSLGVSISRMKSVVFDRWDAQSTRTLLAGGNDKARSKYLARLPRGYAEPTADSDEEPRAAHIRTKYVRLRWAETAYRVEQLEARKVAAAAAGGETKTRKSAARKASAAEPTRRVMPSLSSESM